MPSSSKRQVRLYLLTWAAVVWIVVLLYRLVDLQIANVDQWQNWALKQHLARLKLASERGPLLDRHGRLMAVSVPAGSIYVRPRQVKDRDLVVKNLAALLHLPFKEIEEKLAEKAPFVWIKRQVPRALAEKVESLGLAGLGFVMEARRYYPYNQAAGALIGKVGVDGVGLSGIEMLYERHLRGEEVSTLAFRDAFGKLIQRTPAQALDLPRGDALRLTLDAEIQQILDEELEAGRTLARARAAMGVMLDAESGEILAMGQAPALNLNNATRNAAQDLRNLAIETVFEPGSILKPLVAAAALEARVVNSQEVLNCEGGQFVFGAHTIKDVHPFGALRFYDVVVRSSNIGMSKVGLRLGKDRLYDALLRFGLGSSSGLDLPGESAGILRRPVQWTGIDIATHSFGQGVAVTPLQIVRAISVFANGGILPELKVIQDGRFKSGRRIISEDTARLVREMMYGVVEDKHGTGRLAAIEGVRVGGKTGTAEKPRPNGRGYQPGAYVASFVGFVDALPLGLNKKVSLIVVIDEPRAASIYGGTLAAPVFRRIMQRSLHLLSAENNLRPDRELPVEEERAPSIGPRSQGAFAMLTSVGGA